MVVLWKLLLGDYATSVELFEPCGRASLVRQRAAVSGRQRSHSRQMVHSVAREAFTPSSSSSVASPLFFSEDREPIFANRRR